MVPLFLPLIGALLSPSTSPIPLPLLASTVLILYSCVQNIWYNVGPTVACLSFLSLPLFLNHFPVNLTGARIVGGSAVKGAFAAVESVHGAHLLASSLTGWANHLLHSPSQIKEVDARAALGTQYWVTLGA